jgi:poly-gamma-glutamate capsule biosynthesis protein CapA/YwtB (metallophosphatase superfamily)
VHFEGRLEPLQDDPETALLPIAPQLSAADVTVLNLEAAVTERGVPEPKQFHFRVPERMLAAFPAAGVDVLTMANNHGVDYGRDGLEDTLAAIGRSPVPVVGIGADADQAFAPALVDVRGTTVAVIGADQHPDRTTQAWTATDTEPGVASALDPERLLAAVTAARASADVVVVYLHWGTDYESCPNQRQVTLARDLGLAGADVVVGAHAHELQGMGWYPVDRAAQGAEGPGSVYVSYGLGNFVWWRSNSEVAVTTGILTLTLEGRATVDARWTPMRIADTGLPVVQTGPDALEGLAYWDQVRACSDLSATPVP